MILLNSLSLTSWPILGDPLADYMSLSSYLMFKFRNVKWCSWYGVKWVAEWQDANTIQDKTQVLVLISIYFCKHLESNTCLVETSISAQQLFSTALAVDVFVLLIFSKDCDVVDCVPPKKAMSRSQFLVSQNVALLGNSIFADTISWDEITLDYEGPLLQCDWYPYEKIAMQRQTHWESTM